MQQQSYDRVQDLNHPNPTQRRGSTAVHPAQPWTPSVHAFLRHLKVEGFEYAPRVAGSGFDEDGNEIISWLEGTVFAEFGVAEPAAVAARSWGDAASTP